MKRFEISILLSLLSILNVLAQDTLQLRGPDYFLEGVKYFNGQEWEKARKLFEQTLEEEPGNDAAWYYLGRLHATRSELVEAEHYLVRAHEADTANYWYTIELAKFYADTQRLDQATALYEDLLLKHPGKTTLYSDLLNLYTNSQQYDKAMEILDRRDQLRGANEWTGNFRFELLRLQGRYDEAFRYLEEHEKTYPNPQNAYFLGELYHNQHKDTLAASYYEKALRLDPRYTPAHFGLAEVYRVRGDYPQFFEHIRVFLLDPQMNALFKSEYIQQVLSNPALQHRFQGRVDTLVHSCVNQHATDSTLLYTAGNYFLQTGRHDEGINCYFQVVENYPHDLNPHIQHLYLLYYLQRWQDLEEQSTLSLGFLPGNIDIRQLQAIANWQLLRYDESIEQYKSLLKDIPKDNTSARLMCHSALGDLYQSKQEHKKAYKEYDKALKIDPNYLPVLNNYAYYLSLERKKLDKALQMSRRCIEAEPDNPTYLDTYGYILYLLGDYTSAIAQFKRAMLYGGNQSAVILDHYADTLLASGEKALAMIYWEQADRLDPSLGIAYKIQKHQNK